VHHSCSRHALTPPLLQSLFLGLRRLLPRLISFIAVFPVQHPRQGGWAFGSVTSEVVVEAPTGKQEMNTVFVPTNNLYLGDVILVPRADVLHTGLSVEEGIRVILSAGTVTPSRLPRF